MNQREYYTELLKELHEKWDPIVGVDDWFKDVTLCEDETIENWAEVELCQWEYKKFRIKYFTVIFALPDDRIEWTTVHELCHILRAPERDVVLEILERLDGGDESDALEQLRDMYIRFDERITTDMANALIRAYEAGFKAALAEKNVAIDNKDSRPYE